MPYFGTTTTTTKAYTEDSDGNASQVLNHGLGTKSIGFHARVKAANETWQTLDQIDGFSPLVVATDASNVTITHSGHTPASGEYEYLLIAKG